MTETSNSNSETSAKTAIVTGANSGIGFQAALHLARQGYKVILACRDNNRATDALKRILAVVPNAKVEFSLLNLSNLQSVEKFAERTKAAHSHLEILVNNAAVMAIPERKLSDDGFEMQFATNHLGHFALTARLLPLLTASDQARVVTVSSIAHRYGKLNLDDLQGEHSYEGWKAYGTSKLANLLFSFELARRAGKAGLNLMSMAAHPGLSKTNILNSGPRMGRKVLRTYVSDFFAALLAQTEEQGALPIIHACVSSSAKNGEYFGPDGFLQLAGKATVVDCTPQSQDEGLAKQLWSSTEKLAGLTLL